MSADEYKKQRTNEGENDSGNGGANELNFGQLPTMDLPNQDEFMQGMPDMGGMGAMGGMDMMDGPPGLNIVNRKKRSAIEESLELPAGDFSKLHDWPVSFGPCIVPRNESDIQGAEKAEVGLLETLIPKELYANNEDQVDPQGEIVEILEEAIEEIEDEQEQAAATKMVIMIACIIVGGIIVFSIATLVGFKTDICAFDNDDVSASTKKTKHFKQDKAGIPEPVVMGKPMTMDELARKMQAEAGEGESCGTSMTSAES
jgi:hypothetical protein